MEKQPKLLYKYIGMSTKDSIIRLYDIIKNNHIYFPQYTRLNDPLEGTSLNINVGPMMGNEIVWNADVEDIRIATEKEKYRILSLTDDCCSPQLWAHYGGTYTGVCLCFRTDNHFKCAKQMEYLEEMPIVENISDDYDDDNYERFQQLIQENWLRKETGWSYEKEWRIIKKTNEDYFDFSSNELVGIIFGYKMDEDLKSIIHSWLPDSVKALQANVGGQSYKIYLTNANYVHEFDGSSIPKIENIEMYLLQK